MPPVRLVVTINAAPGRGSDLATAMQPRLAEVRTEPGCEQYELFRSTERPSFFWSAGRARPLWRPTLH